MADDLQQQTADPDVAPTDVLTTESADDRISKILGDNPDELGVEEPEEDESPPAEAKEPDPAEKEETEEADPEDWDISEKTDDEDEVEPANGKFVPDDGRVRLSDGRTVTIAELKAGSLSQEDTVRKQSELGQQTQQIQAAYGQLQQQMQEMKQRSEIALTALSRVAPSEPPPELISTDPFAYSEQKARYDAFVAEASQVMQQYQAADQQQQTLKQQQTTEYEKAQLDALKSDMPALRDPKKWDRFKSEAIDYCLAQGATHSDFDKVTDAWMLKIVADAMRYSKSVKGRPAAAQKVEGKPKVRKPGQRTSKADEVSQRKAQLSRALAKSGRKDIAEALLETMID